MSKPILLKRHPDTDAAAPTPWVRVSRERDFLGLTFRIPGDTSMIAFPERVEPKVKPAPGRRADRLWQHTCFECFVLPEGEAGYLELNFSPSMEWAAYRFDGYREGMRDAEVICPPVIATPWSNRFQLSTRILLPAEWEDLALRLNLAAVIEEKAGRKSYWALAHPPGPPDFHHPDCFALELPAAASL